MITELFKFLFDDEIEVDEHEQTDRAQFVLIDELPELLKEQAE